MAPGWEERFQECECEGNARAGQQGIEHRPGPRTCLTALSSSTEYCRGRVFAKLNSAFTPSSLEAGSSSKSRDAGSWGSANSCVRTRRGGVGRGGLCSAGRYFGSTCKESSGSGCSAPGKSSVPLRALRISRRASQKYGQGLHSNFKTAFASGRGQTEPAACMSGCYPCWRGFEVASKVFCMPIVDTLRCYAHAANGGQSMVNAPQLCADGAPV